MIIFDPSNLEPQVTVYRLITINHSQLVQLTQLRKDLRSMLPSLMEVHVSLSVYMLHETQRCLFKTSRDFCFVSMDREKVRYIEENNVTKQNRGECFQPRIQQ